MVPSSGPTSAPHRTTPANSRRSRGYLALAALAVWLGSACSSRAVFPSSARDRALPCPRSEAHVLLGEGRLFSALGRARAESLAKPRPRGAWPERSRGVCSDREERDLLVARVLAELGACSEARTLSRAPLACRPEPLPAHVALARAAELRESGRIHEAARLSARALQAALAAGQRVRAIPMLPALVGGEPHELTVLEDVLAEHWREWQHHPPVYFLAGSTCVGGVCLLPEGHWVHMPGAEFVNGFAPRRFDYPWRMHPGRLLTADAAGIVDHVARRKIPLEVPEGMLPDRATGTRVADLTFGRDGRSVWGLGWLGRLFAADARTGRLLAEFDLARTCPRVEEPLRLVSASGADVMIARVGTAPGCATLVRTDSQTISELPFAPGELLTLSGDGRVVAVHRDGQVWSYDLEALKWLDPPAPARFDVPPISTLALSFDGSVIALVVPGKEIELPDGGLEVWATELVLRQPNGVPLPGHEPSWMGFRGMPVGGDFGGRVYSLHNLIFDYRGALQAALVTRNRSVLAAFSDGTLETFGPEARSLYRCAIDDQRFPAEDCADAFERPGRLQALVHDVRTDRPRLTRPGHRRRF